MKNKQKGLQNLEWYQNQTLANQISLFSNFLEVAKILANQILEDEIKYIATSNNERGSE